jgi:hypothetical protein
MRIKVSTVNSLVNMFDRDSHDQKMNQVPEAAGSFVRFQQLGRSIDQKFRTFSLDNLPVSPLSHMNAEYCICILC